MSSRGHGRRHRTRTERPTALALARVRAQVRLPAVDRRLKRNELLAHLEDPFRMAMMTVEDAVAVLEGRRSAPPVNPEVLGS